MGLLGHSRKSAAVPRTNPWTKGQALSTRVVIVACWVVLFLVWPVAWTVISAGFETSEATGTSKKIDRGVSPRQQQAGAVAQNYVVAWLSATRDDSDALAAYVDVSSLTLPEEPFEYRNLTVASIAPTPDAGDSFKVQIAGQVKQPATEGDVPPWPHRYFEVTVRLTQSGVTVVGLPTAVTAPPTMGSPLEDYDVQLAAADPVAQSITSFLQAYAAGTGDITRYIAPGSDIAAISPAPYVAVKPVQFATAGDEPTQPGRPGTVRASARVQLVTADGRHITADYTFELISRAGRWEIRAINPSEQSMSTQQVPNRATQAPTKGASQ